MTSQAQTSCPDSIPFDIEQIDLSSLVGHEIPLFTEQFRGRSLRTKVVMVSGGVVSVDRSGGSGMIDCLINNQRTVVQFDYKGQRISVDAKLKRTSGGKCSLVLGENMVPLSRRRFKRFDIVRQVRCAIMQTSIFSAMNLSKLRWIETESINFSSGGVLICLPKQLTRENYLLMNIVAEDFDFPALLVSQVRYAYPVDRFHYRIGNEFIINDSKEQHFSLSAIKSLPPVIFEYSAGQRSDLDKQLIAQMEQTRVQEQ